jgi:hypothetical protein
MRIIILVLLASTLAETSLAQIESKTIRVKASVIGYSVFGNLNGFVGRSSIYWMDDFLVKVVESDQISFGAYVRVMHDHQNGKNRLPRKMYKKSSWYLLLTRDESCDVPIKIFLTPDLKFVSKVRSVSNEETLKCFLLEDGGYSSDRRAFGAKR